MNSILIAPGQAARLRGRVLVVEPDRARASAVREAFREYDGIELEIVERSADAIRSLEKRMPDVLLTSTLLPPSDAESLTKKLKQTPAAAHVQIITSPYFIDEEAEPSDGRVLNFLRRRSELARPRCNARTFRAQIEEYLSQARAIKRDLERRELTDAAVAIRQLAPAPPRPALPPGPPAATTALVPARQSSPLRSSGPALPSDRRRSRRRSAGDLPWLWNVNVSGASHVRIVDISNAGLLLETTSRLPNGTTLDLQLLGRDTNLSVPARMVRSQVASVDGLGVRYHIAIAFARELDLLGSQNPASAPITPKALGGVLTRVLSDLERGASADRLRSRFEQEVRSLLTVRDIQIRHTPLVADWRAESIYFTIPHGFGTHPILQAVFEPDYAPTAAEFHLLKAAANLAAVVLQYASA